MPYPKTPSIYSYRGRDCWRTWFIEECEESGLFGVASGNLKRITSRSFGEGTEFYFEDVPYSRFVDPSQRRICGPYVVVPSAEALDREVERRDGDKVIVFRSLSPASGPWLNGTKKRVIDGKSISHPQMAGNFDFFPYRFSFVKGSNFSVLLIPAA